MLAELPGQQQAHRGLDLPGRDGGALVGVGQAGGFLGDALEHVLNERIKDIHGLLRQAQARVDPIQHPGEIGGEAGDCLLYTSPSPRDS